MDPQLRRVQSLQHLPERLGLQADVYETRTRDLRRLGNTAQVLCDGRGDLLSQVARLEPGVLGQAHGAVGLVVAEGRVLAGPYDRVHVAVVIAEYRHDRLPEGLLEKVGRIRRRCDVHAGHQNLV